MARSEPRWRAMLGGLAALLLLNGCGSSSGDDLWPQYFQILRQSLHNGFKSQDITRAQAAAIPYASLGYRVNGGDEALLVLATDSGAEQIWTAAIHVVLAMQGGRIVRTVGLPHDRSATIPQGAAALPPLADALKAPYRSTRLIDLPELGAYSITLDCITTARGAQTITIIGTAIPTTRVDETCRSANPRWSFTDNYWLNPQSGFVWHGVTQLAPREIVQFEILRPPG